MKIAEGREGLQVSYPAGLEEYLKMMEEFAHTITFNIMSLGKEGKDQASSEHLRSMVAHIQKSQISGQPLHKVISDRNVTTKTENIKPLVGYVRSTVEHMHTMVDRYMADGPRKVAMLARFDRVLAAQSRAVRELISAKIG